jgi:type II secretory pathway component PulK
MRHRKAFLIVTALFVLAVLLVLGMGLMNSQSARYRAAAQSQDTAQALELAMSGLDDARVKLELDANFPPNPAEDQMNFNYAEDVQIAGTDIGSFEVTVDTTYNQPPFYLVKLRVTGSVGPKEKPRAQRVMTSAGDG